jgi:RHS repeat-associated protein
MSPFGFCNRHNFQVHRNGLNGEFIERMTGHYPLGNGHRSYNPHLMRMHSPDAHSPFGRGGMNTYAYCQNDPINWSDPSGRWRLPKRPYWREFSPINFFPLAVLPRQLLRPALPLASARPELLRRSAPAIAVPPDAERKGRRTLPTILDSSPVSLVHAPPALRNWVMAAASGRTRYRYSTLGRRPDDSDQLLETNVPRHGYAPLNSNKLLARMARLRTP